MAAGDYYQTCGVCGKRFLSYPKGRPECLTCWTARCPAVAVSLGAGIAGGIMDTPPLPEVTETFLAEEDEPGPFDDFDRRLREEGVAEYPGLNSAPGETPRRRRADA